MKNEDFDRNYLSKVQSYSKNAIEKFQWLNQHHTDSRSSSIDRAIELETDYIFALKHFEKIVELIKEYGDTVGMKR